MSATNRGAIRRESDFYKTPEQAIDSFIYHFDPGAFIGAHILEPCAGDGAMVRRLKLFCPSTWVTAVELRPEEEENLKQAGADDILCGFDFLSCDWRGSNFDVIITNPPYSIAQEIIGHCFEIAPDAEVIMLLRLAFLESKKPKPFWDKYPLTQLYVLTERPSFTGKSTDAMAYPWFVWSKFR